MRDAGRRAPPVGGAELQPSGGAPRARLGAGVPRAWTVLPAEAGANAHPLDVDAKPTATFSAVDRGCARRRPLLVPPRRRASCARIPRRAFSPTVRTARPRIVDPLAFAWTDADWRGVHARRPGALRDARRHVHARGHVGARRPSSSPRWRASRHHRDRDDAGRRVRRALRLGLRRRRPLRADAPLRHAGRSARVRRSRARRSASASSSTSSTTTSGPTATTWRSSRRTTSPTRTRTTGAARSISKGREPARALLRARTRATGSTSSTSTACASTPRRTSRTRRREHVLADDRRRRARGGAGEARFTSSPRTSRRTRASCARRRQAATASTRSGTTIPPHRGGGADRPPRGVLPRLPGVGAGAHLVRAATATCIRASGTRGRSSGAARRRSICRRTRSSPTSRITTRSPTRAFGRRLHQLVVAGALSRDDRLAAARPGDADAVPGAGVLPRRRRSSISPITSAELARGGSRAAGVEFLSQFPEPDRRPTSCSDCRRRSTRRRSQRCKLDLARARARTRAAYALHRDLLRAAPQRCRCCRAPARNRPKARCSARARSLLRYLDAEHGDRLLIVNLGCDLDFTPARGTAAGAAGRTPVAAGVEQRVARATAARARRRSTPTAPWHHSRRAARRSVRSGLPR